LAFDDLSPRRITLNSGEELHYVREGQGPVVIFIHGAMGDFRSSEPQWAEFTKTYDCISYSRRYSYPNRNELKTSDHNALVDAADLAGLMDVLQIEKAALVGSSYGGFTALAFAVQNPLRATAIVSVEAPMMKYALQSKDSAPVAEAFLNASARPARAAFEKGENALGTRILTGGIVGAQPDKVPDDVIERRMQNLTAARSLALSDDEFPMLERDALADLPMPVFLISGQDTAPVHAAIFSEVCQAMPRAKSLVVPNSGHSVSQQAAAKFNAEVLNFFAEHNV
jgi:pimeloyl-ACP methyl ester carboxylesterase